MSILRLPHFIRRYIRRTTKKIPEVRAHFFRSKLSLAYAFCAWNLFGFIFYLVYTDRIKKIEDDSGLSQGRQFVRLLKMENVHLFHIDNLKSVHHFDLNKEYTKRSEETAATTSQDDQE